MGAGGQRRGVVASIYSAARPISRPGLDRQITVTAASGPIPAGAVWRRRAPSTKGAL